MYETALIYRPLCMFCKHFNIENTQPSIQEKPSCKAFPEIIPLEIWKLVYDHREPHPDDNGVQFELTEDFENFQKSTLGQHHYGNFSLDQLQQRFEDHIAEVTRNMELRRIAEIAQPPLDENDKRSQLRTYKEVMLVIDYRCAKEANDFATAFYEETGEHLSKFEYGLFRLKARLRIALEYLLENAEVDYVEKNYAYANFEGVDACVVEVYCSLDREKRLIEIYRKLGRLDQLKVVYRYLGGELPSDIDL